MKHWATLRTFQLACLVVCLVACIGAGIANAQGSTPVRTLGQSLDDLDVLIEAIDKHWSTERFRTRVERASPFLIPLGAMQKRDGVWRPEEFWPIDGEVGRVTWSVRGESITTLFETFRLSLMAEHTLRWECQGRSCGNAAEWASRVFKERLLYGRDEFMRYGAFENAQGDWVILYSAARTADRQYLHVDIVRAR